MTASRTPATTGSRSEDGLVQEFDSGIVVGEANGNRVLGITSRRQFFFGALLFGSAHNVIRGGTFSHNIPPAGDGIGVFESRHIRIVDNEIGSNEGPGIHLGESSMNVVKENTFARNGPSVSIEGNANYVTDNRVVGGAGILAIVGDRNVITKNHVSRALDSIGLDDGRRNLVAHNLVTRARGTQAISVGHNRPPIGGGGDVVRENRVKNSRGDGFIVSTIRQQQRAEEKRRDRCGRRRLRYQRSLGEARREPSAAQRRSRHRRRPELHRRRRQRRPAQRGRSPVHEHRVQVIVSDTRELPLSMRATVKQPETRPAPQSAPFAWE